MAYAPADLNGSPVWDMTNKEFGDTPITPTQHEPGCGYWTKNYVPYNPNVYFLWESAFGNRIVCIKNPEFTYKIGPAITAFGTTTEKAIIDPNNQYYYIGSYGYLYKIDLPAGTIHDYISISSYTTRKIVTMVVDRYNRILYALTDGNDENPCYIFKIDLATFTIIDYGTMTLPTQLPYAIKTAVIDDVNKDYIYAGGFAYFYKIDIATLTYHSRIVGLQDPACSVIDVENGYGYFAGGETQKIDRLTLDSFTKDELIIPTGYGTDIGLGIDLNHGFLYHVPPPVGLTTPPTIYQIELLSFSILRSEVLNTDGYTGSIVVDPVNQKVFAGMVSGTTSSVRRFNTKTYLQQGLIYYGHSAKYGVIEGQNTV